MRLLINSLIKMDTNLYSPLLELYTIQDLQKNKLARHSINYKEESWKGVRLIGLGWKYHYY